MKQKNNKNYNFCLSAATVRDNQCQNIQFCEITIHVCPGEDADKQTNKQKTNDRKQKIRFFRISREI